MTTLAERMNLLASTAKSGKTDKDGFRTRGQLPHVFDYDTPEVLTATDHTKRQNIRNKIKRKLLKLSQPPKEKKPRISRSRARTAPPSDVFDWDAYRQRCRDSWIEAALVQRGS